MKPSLHITLLAAALPLLSACEQQQEQTVTPTSANASNTVPAPENVAAPPANASVTASGLSYIVLKDEPGDEHAEISDQVTVHYTGWTTDGKMFDSSITRGKPATFPLGRVITGWQEAVPLMTPGDKYRFWIPGNLAYDNSTRPDAPKGMLVFDIELLVIQKPEAQK